MSLVKFSAANDGVYNEFIQILFLRHSRRFDRESSGLRYPTKVAGFPIEALENDGLSCQLRFIKTPISLSRGKDIART